MNAGQRDYGRGSAARHTAGALANAYKRGWGRCADCAQQAGRAPVMKEGASAAPASWAMVSMVAASKCSCGGRGAGIGHATRLSAAWLAPIALQATQRQRLAAGGRPPTTLSTNTAFPARRASTTTCGDCLGRLQPAVPIYTERPGCLRMTPHIITLASAPARPLTTTAPTLGLLATRS